MDLFGSVYNSIIINVSFLISYMLLTVQMFKDEIKSSNIVKCVLLIVFLPLAIYSQVFATMSFTTYNQFGILIFFIGAIIIVLERLRKYKDVYMIIIFIFLFLNVNMLNEILFVETINSEQIQTFGTQLIHDISSTPNYDKTKNIQFCGNLKYNYNFTYVKGKKPFTFTDFHLRSGNSKYVINEDNTRGIMAIINTLGFDYKVVKNGNCSLVNDEPMYPEEGYIKEVDNIFYVKLGGTYDEEASKA